MFSSTKTVKSDWSIDLDRLKLIGFLQSPLFGTDWTKFYWRTEQQADHFNLYLYLSASNQERITVNCSITHVVEITGSTNSTDSVKGEISLDKRFKVGWNKVAKLNWPKNHNYTIYYKVSATLTFTEIDTHKLILQFDHLSQLSKQLLKVSTDSQADITLITTVDEQELPAHKAILSARSPVFAAMLSGDGFLENKQNRVEIDDVSGPVMERLLKYIYSGDASAVGENVDELLLVSDKYDISGLVQACLQVSLTSLSAENAARLFYFAHLHHLEDLQRTIACFIKENKESTQNSADWKQYMSGNAKAIEQLYFS